jgi:CHAD domain-containing protein
VAQRVRQIAGPETPREIFSVHKKRQRYLLRPDRQTTIELALDLADIRSAEAPKSGAPGKLVFRELEMELVSGAREHVDRLSAVLERDFGLLPARLSKYERGLQASGLQPPLPSLLACGPATTPETPTVWFAFRCLDDLLHALRLHEGGTWEGLHPEALHQMRVATRRIRSAFSVFRAAFPERAHRSFSRELRWLAGTLGPARDIEVHQGDLEPYVRTLAAGDQAQIQPYREALEGERQKARKAVRAALDSGRCRRLIERLGSLVRRGPAKRRLRGPQPVGEFARRAMSRTLRKVLRAGRKVAKGPSQEQMHRLRIRCKRLRYTLEFFMPLFGDKALKPFAKALRRLQNVLGEHRDACVASERLRGYAEKVPARGGRQGLLLALGQLISAYERAAEQYRSDFPGVWRELDRGKTRQRLKMALNKTVSSKQGV